MSWFTDCTALHARIQSLIDAGTFFFRAQHGSAIDLANPSVEAKSK